MRGLKEHELGDSQLLHQVFRLDYTNIGMAQFHLNVTADALRGKVILVTGNTATHTHVTGTKDNKIQEEQTALDQAWSNYAVRWERTSALATSPQHRVEDVRSDRPCSRWRWDSRDRELFRSVLDYGECSSRLDVQRMIAKP